MAKIKLLNFIPDWLLERLLIFHVFFPKTYCPVKQDEKEWIEGRFSWLVAEFGLDRLRNSPLILPTIEYFPDQYEASRAEIQNILNKVAEYMGVNPDKLQLDLYYDKQLASMGKYEERAGIYYIGVELSYLEDPLTVVMKFPNVCGRWYGLVNVGNLFPSIVLGGFAFVGAGCRSLTLSW